MVSTKPASGPSIQNANALRTLARIQVQRSKIQNPRPGEERAWRPSKIWRSGSVAQTCALSFIKAYVVARILGSRIRSHTPRCPSLLISQRVTNQIPGTNTSAPRNLPRAHAATSKPNCITGAEAGFIERRKALQFIDEATKISRMIQGLIKHYGAETIS